jgi:hypothetical protein
MQCCQYQLYFLCASSTSVNSVVLPSHQTQLTFRAFMELLRSYLILPTVSRLAGYVETSTAKLKSFNGIHLPSFSTFQTMLMLIIAHTACASRQQNSMFRSLNHASKSVIKVGPAASGTEVRDNSNLGSVTSWLGKRRLQALSKFAYGNSGTEFDGDT